MPVYKCDKCGKVHRSEEDCEFAKTIKEMIGPPGRPLMPGIVRHTSQADRNEIAGLRERLAAAQRELAEARRQRDLAIAHDRQPYPTAHAYEQVCKANEAKRIEIEELKDFANGLIALAKEMLPICPEKARAMLGRAMERGQEMRSNATAEIERLRNLVDTLRLEAQIHSIEARTQTATVHEAYQAATGGKGEPGSWHGANPIREALDAKDKEIERLRGAVKDAAKSLESIEAGRASEESNPWEIREYARSRKLAAEAALAGAGEEKKNEKTPAEKEPEETD